MHKLKKWRIAVSLLFFLMFLWEFAALKAANEYFTHTVNALQFFPSLLEFTATFLAGGGSGFMLILVLTLIFGRVYCSFLCPMGFVQDAVIRVKGKGLKIKTKYEKPQYTLHYAVTGITLLLLVFGVADVLGALDPFANFGRMAAVLVEPVYAYLNNAAAYALNTFENYSLKPVQMNHISISLLSFTAGFSAMIIFMAVFKGRFYCNTLCPVGGILSLASRRPVYRIKISAEKCTECGLCEKACKANCIDLKGAKVDNARCVACFNCLGACKTGAITYSRTKSLKTVDGGRRAAIKAMAAAGAGAALLLLPDKAAAEDEKGLSPVRDRTGVIPPGAGDFKTFNSRCISCQLCVSSCPTKVITAKFLEGGAGGFLQPRLDFERSYCNYSCNTCSHACPTGALNALTIADKRTTKIGGAKFVKENCIVHTKKQECLVCNEYCPTKACSLVPYAKGLKIPKVIDSLCIGCGACENRCPATPKKAIYVEGLLVHTKADKPSERQKQWKGGKDFPF